MNNIFRIKKKYFGAEDWKTLEQLILHFWFLYTFSIIESKNADFIMFLGRHSVDLLLSSAYAVVWRHNESQKTAPSDRSTVQHMYYRKLQKAQSTFSLVLW